MQKHNARWSEKALAETLVGVLVQVTHGGDKDGGMDDGSDINSKRDITGSAGMLRLRIPAI